MPFPKRLIVNADDFGLHSSINAAIELAHLQGIVTSTSLMPGAQAAPAYDHAVAIAQRHPTLAIGLHFTLVGAPGLPQDYGAFMKAKLAGAFPASRLTTLLHRQLDTLEASGIQVTHIDSHQHLHALPSIMKVVASVAAERGIRAVRLPLESGDYAGAAKGRVAAAKVLAILCLISRRELLRRDINFPGHFFGMAVSGALTEGAMVRLLKQLPEGTSEILCHPGESNEQLAKQFAWKYDWQSELNAVTAPAVLTTCVELQIERIRFDTLSPRRSP